MKRLLIAIVLLAAMPGISIAATVGFAPESIEVTLHEVFTLNITGRDFPITEGGGVNFFYDRSIVNVVSVDIDASLWNFVNLTGTIDNATGQVTNILLSTFLDTPADFVIATLELRAVGLGSSLLSLTETDLNPWSSSALLLQSNFASSLVNPDYLTGSITVSPIPLPAAAWLFGSGVIGLFGLLRRKRANAATSS